jgi:hypothetical protein
MIPEAHMRGRVVETDDGPYVLAAAVHLPADEITSASYIVIYRAASRHSIDRFEVLDVEDEVFAVGTLIYVDDLDRLHLAWDGPTHLSYADALQELARRVTTVAAA